MNIFYVTIINILYHRLSYFQKDTQLLIDSRASYKLTKRSQLEGSDDVTAVSLPWCPDSIGLTT